MRAPMTMPLEPGERRPDDRPPDGEVRRTAQPDDGPSTTRTILERPPGDRYGPRPASETRTRGPFGALRPVLAVVVVGALGFVVLGGVLAVTAGLIVAAGLIGWLIGLLVRPPAWAALIAVGVVLIGLLGIWLFGRWEGGVLDPIEYFAEVQGFLVPLELLAAGGLAAAASR